MCRLLSGYQSPKTTQKIEETCLIKVEVYARKSCLKKPVATNGPNVINAVHGSEIQWNDLEGINYKTSCP